MRRLSPLLAALAVALCVLVVVQLVARARTGPLPLAGVFEVHLLALAVVVALLAVPGALGEGRRRAWTRVAILGVLVLGVIRLGGELWSAGPSDAALASEGAAEELRVLSWNLESGSKAAATAVDGIAAIDADLVALQELTPDAAAAIEGDATLRARYPYRILEPDAGVDGMGILAKRPLLARGSQHDPRILRAGLLLADGRTLEVLDVHPYPPAIAMAAGVPVGLDTRRRDEDLGVIAGTVEGLDDPDAALVVGDLNTTPTEAGIAGLAAALTDAHAAAGTGPGFTWRPSRLEGTGLGLLRIDHVLTGRWLEATAADADCSMPGDHCRLVVTLQVVPART